MQTMHPVLYRGCAAWDQERLPVDEFEERLRSIQAAMKENRLDGLIIYGNGRDYAKLCYVTNYVPRTRWAFALIPQAGRPVLAARVGSVRDLPAVKLSTWVEDVRFAKDFSEDVRQFVGQISGSGSPAIGICGKERMTVSMLSSIEAGCLGLALQDADLLLDRLLQIKRPREIAVMRESANILQSAVMAMKERHQRGGSVMTSVVEAERIARYLGAQDTRVLFSLDNGKSLQPFETFTEDRNDTMMVYLAVEYLGYWAEAMVTINQQQHPVYERAREVLQFFAQSLAPGAKIANLVQDAAEKIKPYRLHPVAQGGFGCGIGLSLGERPFLQPAFGGEEVQAGEVYSIHAGLSDPDEHHALLSAMVWVKPDGNETLWMSD